MKSADNFESVVKDVVGDKQGFHTFSYDDVMAIVTAGRACVNEARGYANRPEQDEPTRDPEAPQSPTQGNSSEIGTILASAPEQPATTGEGGDDAPN